MINQQNNPFIVGDWIRNDADFIGRQALLHRYASLDRPGRWLIGARRMGKTSFLRALQRRLRMSPHVYPVFWDVSGVTTAHDVKLSLIDALEACEQDWCISPSPPDYARLEAGSFGDLLRWLRRQHQGRNARFVILLDESEALINAGALDPFLLSQLKQQFSSADHLNLIMASNHGLAQYDRLNTDHFSADFLQTLMPPDYLLPFTAQESAPLIQRLKGEVGQLEAVFALVGGLPFILQMLCYYIWETGSMSEAVQNISSQQLLDLFFRDDLRFLDDCDNDIIRLVYQNEPVSEKRLVSCFPLSPAELNRRISTLYRLGLIREAPEGQLALSNHFLREWFGQFGGEAGAFMQNASAETGGALCLLFGKNEAHEMRWAPPQNDTVLHCRTPNAQQCEYLENTGPLTLRQRGRALYKTIFESEQRDTFQSVCDRAEKICIENHSIGVALPFELLHDGSGFLALSKPVVRSIWHSLEKERAFDRPIKFLLIASNTPPDIELANQEIRLLKRQLEQSAPLHSRPVEVSALLSEEASWENVSALLMKGGYTHLHYAGHCRDGMLFFRSAQGVKACDLQLLCRMLETPLQLLYINACDSGPALLGLSGELQGKAVRPVARYCLGLNKKADDRLAAEFAADFYKQLFQYQFKPDQALFQARRRWADRMRHRPKVADFWQQAVLLENSGCFAVS